MIIGHGTTRNADSCAPVYQHAAELRRRRLFAEVREAFWKQEPQVQGVLKDLSRQRVLIVPFFLSEGYFGGRVILRELGFAPDGGEETRFLRRDGRTLVYCRAVGTDPKMAGVVLARAREVTKRFPFPRAPQLGEVTLVIAGHGTERDPGSRRAVERQVELIRGMNLYAAVEAVFLEEAPRIGECYGMARTRNLVVVPFFLSDGLHVREDIPVRLGESERVVKERLEAGKPTWRNPTERGGKLVWYASGVGTEPLMAEVILDRVMEAAGGGENP